MQQQLYYNKMKKRQKYHTVGTIQNLKIKSNRKKQN